MGQYYECWTCDKAFPAGYRAREMHCVATGHVRLPYECARCHVWATDAAGIDRHMNRWNHFAHECRVCDETWPSEEAREAHERDEHYYCAECERTFRNLNNLQMASAAGTHLQSRTHRGDAMTCPFCRRGFTSATGMTHHLERAACPDAPQLNRDSIYRIVRERDPTGRISKHLITWHGSSTYTANEGSWNGSGYECYICKRTFGKLQGLNAHLASPIHQETLYHCPNGRCATDFKSLASLINHLESESCNFMRFDTVQHSMGALVSSNRRIAF